MLLLSTRCRWILIGVLALAPACDSSGSFAKGASPGTDDDDGSSGSVPSDDGPGQDAGDGSDSGNNGTTNSSGGTDGDSGSTGSDANGTSTGSNGDDGAEDTGCQDPPDTSTSDGCEDFVSDLPNLPGQPRVSHSRGGLRRQEAAPPAGPEQASAAALLSNAEVVHIEGKTLYALSQYAGLTIIDISDLDHLRVLGSHRGTSKPFALELDNGIAYLALRDAGHEVIAGNREVWWEATSRLQALDVRDPAHIKLLSERVIAGTLSHSYKSGSIIYLAADDRGECRGCKANPHTRILSLDLSDPAKLTAVAELTIARPDGISGPLGMTFTDQRIYVAGELQAEADTTLRVIDLTGGPGTLRFGAELTLRGAVYQATQMDERAGVLRVLSQPTTSTGGSLSLQTFRVRSADALTSLATLTVPAPPSPYEPWVMWFDANRAFAGSAAANPLLTFDLSNSRAPTQAGSLALNGSVERFQLDGDRLYVFGANDAQTAETMFLQTVDVSNLDRPTTLDRVDFGSSAYHGEGLEVLPDQGLVIIPFGGGSHPTTCKNEHRSGIQLIDDQDGQLTLRELAPLRGQGLHALLHGGRLIGISDDAVEVFDITDRSAVKSTGLQALARSTWQVRSLGDSLLRFGYDWWTRSKALDIAPLEEPSAMAPNELDIASSLGEAAISCSGGTIQAEGLVYLHGDVAYVPFRDHRENADSQTDWQALVFLVLDIGLEVPKVVGKFQVEQTGVNAGLGGVVLTDHALLVARWDLVESSPGVMERKLSYDVFDLTDPRAPKLASQFEIPGPIVKRGFGSGAYATSIDVGSSVRSYSDSVPSLLAAGDLVFSQHAEKVRSQPTRARYYLDRLDVSNPSAPKLLEPVNIPGYVLRYEVHNDLPRIVTSDYRERVVALSPESCAGQRQGAWYDPAKGVCHAFDRRIHVLDLHEPRARRIHLTALDSGERVSTYVAVSDSRIFSTTVAREPSSGPAYPLRMETLAYTESGALQHLPATLLDLPEDAIQDHVAGRDTRAFFVEPAANTLAVIGTDASPTQALYRFGEFSCFTVELARDRAYCAANENGVLTFALE